MLAQVLERLDVADLNNIVLHSDPKHRPKLPKPHHVTRPWERTTGPELSTKDEVAAFFGANIKVDPSTSDRN